VTPMSQEELNRLAKLLFVGLFGTLAWVANHLFHGKKLPLGRFIGGLLGSLIASMSMVGLLHIAYQSPSIELQFGIAGIVGWAGGNSLARVFEALENRLYDIISGDEEDE